MLLRYTGCISSLGRKHFMGLGADAVFDELNLPDGYILIIMFSTIHYHNTLFLECTEMISFSSFPTLCLPQEDPGSLWPSHTVCCNSHKHLHFDCMTFFFLRNSQSLHSVLSTITVLHNFLYSNHPFFFFSLEQ